MHKHLTGLLLFLALLSGCVTNPVTGKNDFSLVSEQQELAIGAQQYAPARQAQGGDLVADPGLTAYVSQVGQRLAAVSDRKLPYEFKVLNNSVPNAWALPGGKITINRGLLTELHNESELAAVLGHEIVHAAARHGAQSMSKGMLLQTAVMGTAIATQGKDYANLAQLGAGLGAQLVTQKYGRDAERESDHYGMLYMSRAGYDPQGAVELQRTFVRLSEGKQQDWLNGMFASHPPSQERVNNNIAMLATLPRGGEVGAERYRAKTAHLMRSKPAYDAFDQGREALAKGDTATAMRLAKQAIALEPNEAHFYGLMGDAEQKSGHLSAAAGLYGKAINLNPGFFYYSLQRGKVNEQLHLDTSARADFERSTALLPTADAYYSLGNLSRKAGRLDEAKGYYTKVASAQGEIGKQAYGDLVDLDLKDNPSKYIQLRAGKDAQGRIVAQLANPTPRNVNGIVLLVRFTNAAGQPQQIQRNFNGVLASGTQQLLDLGLSGLVSDDRLNTLQVGITQAQVAR
ncbi:MAG: peptidase M48 [Zetaproteobacteria bacterium CG06_land_8_20_14_3_00_59_53]|nr:MAG: peptidase M48 [Zetaproteobacteria bacterium CG2_30_59_37]PIO90233.1 MAG: peptidase M48 [Zetaproteobacteria bacterium CG23_combo_of_CG06-09_8_20_14_all_59_86]PIQ64580.1 MAG: peptidase M48 [Zetaproteobacteria bacterium CG11_big_fil_rev_8_21_14_0_20_59_439]PIU71280.1 MAG: peptidase M48 [Zetaproteobacteria bacterium CG06_land_8_20_14_3_00_59_53]PIU97215.1 MAG: peptidase M48 [Zetaproteobacteria bacterium CG03_land_8_20_14_0_80_59_51]PIY45978.1 MAG: peptidase M48 [Zetaproteobacteria bacteriu